SGGREAGGGGVCRPGDGPLPDEGVQGGEPAALQGQGPVREGEEPGVRHRPVGPGGARLGAVRGFQEVPALGQLGGEPPLLVRHRPEGEDHLHLAADVLEPDLLREGHRPHAGAPEESTTIASSEPFLPGESCVRSSCALPAGTASVAIPMSATSAVARACYPSPHRADMSFTVFYLNPRATDEVLATVREQMPADWR